MRLPRMLVLAIAFVLPLGIAAPSLAGPITINYTLVWDLQDRSQLFRDPEDNPDLVALDAALRALGIGLDSLFTLSLTLDTNIADHDPDPNNGYFPGAATARMWLGDNLYSFGPTDIEVSSIGQIRFTGTFSGPALSANGWTFIPTQFLFSWEHLPLTSDALTVSNFTGFAGDPFATQHNSLVFYSDGNREAIPWIASASVPEPTSLMLTIGAAFGSLWLKRRRRRLAD